METSNRIYTERVKAGKRTYFFDIKKNKEDSRYLLITESKKIGEDEFSRHTIMVHKEDIDKIEAAFIKAIAAFRSDVLPGETQSQ